MTTTTTDPIELIRQQYPWLAYLINIDPEVTKLLLELVDVNQGFDPTTFEFRLESTNWWRTTSAAQRNWLALTTTDPASAQTQRDDFMAGASDLAGQLGVDLSSDQLRFITELALSHGQTVNSAGFRDGLLSLAQFSTTGQQGGQIGATQEQLLGIATQQYMVPLSAQDAFNWSTQIASGATTMEGFQAAMSHLAAGRFPTLSGLIDQGVTPGQYFAPMRNAIATNIEAAPESIDLLNDPRWSQVSGTADANGVMRPMTLQESISLARSSPEFRRTAGGNQMSADLTQYLLQTFGAIQ